jgi:apolipoprotein N-acyltransferase
MSVHLYNLGADMNISNGLDRMGKVVFWLSFLVVAGVAALLAFGSTDPKFAFGLGFLTLVAVLVTGGIYDEHVKRPSAWSGVFCLWYNLAITAWLMNKLPHTDVWLALVVYIAPLVTLAILYAIGKYVFTGFTQKS